MILMWPFKGASESKAALIPTPAAAYWLTLQTSVLTRGMGHSGVQVRLGLGVQALGTTFYPAERHSHAREGYREPSTARSH